MPKSRYACDACFRRKIQCDLSGPGPKCNWCNHRGDPCTFDRVRLKLDRNGKHKSRRDIAGRIERIESAIVSNAVFRDSATSIRAITSTPNSTNASVDTPGDGSQTPRGDSQLTYTSTKTVTLGKIYLGGQLLGAINSHNSMPCLSDQGLRTVFSSTDEWPSLPSIADVDSLERQYSLGCHPLALIREAQPNQYPRLPEPALVRSLRDVFLASDLSNVFPFLDPVLFEDTLSHAYNSHDETRILQHVSAKSCVFAFLAFCGVHFSQTSAGTQVDCHKCAMESQTLVSSIMEDASLANLQTMIMLQLYHTASGRLQASSMCHSLACRTVFTLGGHSTVPPPLGAREPSIKERQERLLRNIFWLVYVVDKEIALRTGQPLIIYDEFCDLTLPEGYAEQRSMAFVADASDPRNVIPSLPGDIRLSFLKARTCRVLYSIEASRKSDVELLRSIRELDEELESWLESVPAQFAPTRSAKSKSGGWGRGVYDTEATNMRRIMLNLEYHHLMTIIHSAAGRCMKPPGTHATETKSMGLELSLELSVEASRATLAHVGTAANKFPAEAFWILIFYPMSALMILFFKILRDPLEDEAANDVLLIESVAGLIRASSSRQPLAQRDAARLEELNRFIEELYRLGNLAISKAKGKREH